LNLSTFPLIY